MGGGGQGREVAGRGVGEVDQQEIVLNCFEIKSRYLTYFYCLKLRIPLIFVNCFEVKVRTGSLNVKCLVMKACIFFLYVSYLVVTSAIFYVNYLVMKACIFYLYVDYLAKRLVYST